MSEPRVVAVVCSYWPNRQVNLWTILDDLLAGSCVPDRIIVLQNNPERTLVNAHGAVVSVINLPWNSECRGKFVVGLLDVADYYLFLDDDTSVGRTTLETLLAHARPDTCTGYLGVYLAPDEQGLLSFWKGGRLWPHDAEVETPCQTFCGCAMFCSFSSVVRMLVAETRVRLPTSRDRSYIGDDILLGLANASTVVPLRGDARFVDLGYQGQAMFYSIADYQEERDVFTREVVEALADHPIGD